MLVAGFGRKTKGDGREYAGFARPAIADADELGNVVPWL